MCNIMKKIYVTTGEIYGLLTVLEEVAPAQMTGRRARKFKCVCQCRNQVVVFLWDLRSGKTVSCGCYNSRKTSERNFKHGMCDTGTYRSWTSMLSRCESRKNKDFWRYGGRGVGVCSRWKESFKNFLEDMGECPLGLTLDRIDSDGNYEPDNCRWATRLVQSRNRRNVLKNFNS